MPNGPFILTVNIVKDPNNPHVCVAKQHFRALPRQTVEFLFPEQPDADIIFIGTSPFGNSIFKPSQQTVRDGLPIPSSYGYIIQWQSNGGGNGNGGGEVP
jgi:hypothetical protein